MAQMPQPQIPLPCLLVAPIDIIPARVLVFDAIPLPLFQPILVPVAPAEPITAKPMGRLMGLTFPPSYKEWSVPTGRIFPTGNR